VINCLTAFLIHFIVRLLMNYKKFTSILSVLIIFSFIFTASASARFVFPGNDRVLSETDESTASATRRDKIKERIHDRLEKLKEKFEERLEARKEKICERIEAKITKRSDRLVEKAGNMASRFDKIVGKVKDYYTEKLVPRGVVVENYDALVADIEAKKMKVTEALDSAGEVISEFDCSGEKPKGILSLFRDDMKNVITALREYRKSVVNLIVAIRTKGKNIKTEEATSSATP